MILAAIASTGAAAAADILAAAAGVRYVVHSIDFNVSAAASVKIHWGTSGATTNLVHLAYVAANGGLTITFPGGHTGPTNTALKLTTDTGNISGVVRYTKSQD